MKRAVVEFKSNDKMVETRFNLRSSLRWIGFLFLAFLVVTFPVLGQNYEITLSLGRIPVSRAIFNARPRARPKFPLTSVWGPTTATAFWTHTSPRSMAKSNLWLCLIEAGSHDCNSPAKLRFTIRHARGAAEDLSEFAPVAVGLRGRRICPL
jgi:hypothetical protein